MLDYTPPSLSTMLIILTHCGGGVACPRPLTPFLMFHGLGESSLLLRSTKAWEAIFTLCANVRTRVWNAKCNKIISVRHTAILRDISRICAQNHWQRRSIITAKYYGEISPPAWNSVMVLRRNIMSQL